MIHNVRGVVLWSRRSRDADKIVTLFTDKLGRITAKATSAAKASAKFAGLTEPFVESDLSIYLMPGQGWGKIVGGQIRRAFPGLRTQIDRSTAAAWVCEVMYRLTPEEQKSPDKFELLLETLETLETAKQFSLIRLAFALRFLNLAGFGVDNRDPWQALLQEYPANAEALMTTPLIGLIEAEWSHISLKNLELLAGGIVSDYLARPLQVNRFRQMTGINI